MANYVLNRTHTHRSTMGVVSFIKGEPTAVPSMLEKEVIAIGAVREEGVTPDVLSDAPSAPEPLTQTQRVDELFLAFELIIAGNESKDFTGAGVPTVKAVEKIVGFDVDRVEIGEAWAQYKVAKAEE